MDSINIEIIGMLRDGHIDVKAAPALLIGRALKQRRGADEAPMKWR